MLNDLDDTIRELLVTQGQFDPLDVDISFDIPNREWSQGITKPTLNCYLFDIHERRLLREEGWQIEGRGERAPARRHPPLFFEITYLITAWTAQVEDEHRLLWRALATLMDHPVLPAEVLQGDLATRHEWPLHTSVAQLEGVLKSPGEFWTALENQLKPSISYVVLLGRNRRAQVLDAPPVLPGGIRVRLPETRAGGAIRLGAIFGVADGTSLAGVRATVRSLNPQTSAPLDVVAEPVADDDGRVTLDLPPGRYLLEMQHGERSFRRTVVLTDPAANPPARYSGVVKDQRDTPLPGVAVEVEGGNQRTVTDAEGRFWLDIAPGRHTLLIQMDGWIERREVLWREPGYRLTLGYGGVPAPSQ
jgi:hypothetical protein